MFFLSNKFEESYKLTKALEETIGENEIHDLIVLQTLLNISVESYTEATNLINKMILLGETENSVLYLENDFSLICEESEIPVLQDTKNLHALLLLADIWLQEKKYINSKRLVDNYFIQSKMHQTNMFHYYAFWLQTQLMEHTEHREKHFHFLYELVNLSVDSHKLEYNLFKSQYLVLLYKEMKYSELSFYELFNESQKEDNVNQHYDSGYVLDENDFAPLLRLHPKVNNSINLIGNSFYRVLNRIKLSPQIFVYLLSVLMGYLC
jgi:hypothetical protein